MVPDLLLLLFVLIHSTLILVVVLFSVVIVLIVAVILSFLIILWMLGNDLYRLLCQMLQFLNSAASSLFWVFLFVVSLVVRIVSGFVRFFVEGAYSMVSEHGIWTDYNISNKR